MPASRVSKWNGDSRGVRFLKERQGPDGPGPTLIQAAQTGPTSLAVIALLTAGEKPGSPTIQRALEAPEAVRARTAQQHLCDLASDHGLRRGGA